VPTKIGILAVVVIALSSAEAGAQYARPVEVAPARPFIPGAEHDRAESGCSRADDHQSAHGRRAEPASHCSELQARPRKCWCYLVNPVTNSRQRTTCEISCCKGGEQDDRC